MVAVVSAAKVESETHIIQNSLTSLGNAIVNLGGFVVNNTKKIIYSEIISVSSQMLKEDNYNFVSTNTDSYARPGQKNKVESLKIREGNDLLKR